MRQASVPDAQAPHAQPPSRERIRELLGWNMLLAAGAGFYWLEPHVHSFGVGL